MSEKAHKETILKFKAGSQNEELAMRDVLDGLQDIASILSYDPWPGDFEIVAIYPPDQEHLQSREETVIKAPHRIKPQQKAKILSYKHGKSLATARLSA